MSEVRIEIIGRMAGQDYVLGHVDLDSDSWWHALPDALRETADALTEEARLQSEEESP